MKKAILYYMIPALAIGPLLLSAQNAEASSAKLKLIVSPPVPQAFQRVYVRFERPLVDSTDPTKGNEDEASQVAIIWTVDGDIVDQCADSTYCSFRMGPASAVRTTDKDDPHNFDIKVEYDGKNVGIGEVVVAPVLSDWGQRDHLVDAGDCAAQTLNMLADDIDRISKMYTDTLNQLDKMQQQFFDDIDFLTEALNFDDMLSSLEDDIDNVRLTWSGISAANSIPGYLRAGADVIRGTLKIYLHGNIAQELARIQKIIDRYKNMQKTLDRMKKLRQAQLLGMANQMNRQAAMCAQRFQKVNRHGL